MIFLHFKSALRFTQRFFCKYVLLATKHINKLAEPENGLSHAGKYQEMNFYLINF